MTEPFDFTDANQRRLAERAIGYLGLAFILDLCDLIRAIRERGFGKLVIVIKNSLSLFEITDSRKPKRDWREWLEDEESI